MDANLTVYLFALPPCFNPRARDGREAADTAPAMVALCFNPRARDGREALANGTDFRDFVSIHAPVMDANKAAHTLTGTPRFNPRARDGREVIGAE